MPALIIACLGVAIALQATAPDVVEIHPDDAPRHVGDRVIVEGQVVGEDPWGLSDGSAVLRVDGRLPDATRARVQGTLAAAPDGLVLHAEHVWTS